jgi:ZIP family zinc transporter
MTTVFILAYAAGMAVLVALTTVLSTALGGFVALRAQDRLHLVLGFAAGVMLGLVAFDLLPELFELSDATFGGVPAVMVAFAVGFLLLHFVERSVAMHGAHEGEYGKHHHDPSVGLASATALAVHSFLDGVGIGLAFQVDEMRTHGNDQRRTLLMLGIDALAPVLGAASTLFFSVGDGVLALYLGAFAGFLLYLATADILPEAHARHPSRLTLLSTLGGLGLMWFVVAAS